MDILIPVTILSGLGLAFGLGLSYASKVFEVKVDERIGKVREMLPGANCGGCGFTGCDGLAEAIVNDGASPSRCPVGGSSMVTAISEYMGLNESAAEKKVARVICQGTIENVQAKYEYMGITDCHAANALAGGGNSCSYGCLGLGSCVRACPFGAITIIDGVAHVDQEICTGCTNCVAECPKSIIKMVPISSKVTVLCANKEKGAITRKNCKVGCIACQKCVKACPSGAITVSNNLAVIDPEKCTNCEECVLVCPQKTIINTALKCASLK